VLHAYCLITAPAAVSLSLMMSSAEGRRAVWKWSGAALLPPAAFAVHQLRFLLAFGSGAGAELERTGHSYMHSFVPWLVVLLALVVGGFLRELGRALGGQTSAARFTISFAGLWLTCTAALVLVYCLQEFLEGILVVGHPAGLVGIFGYGGWWAIPVAACIGLVLAAVFHGARWLIDETAARRRVLVVRRARVAQPRWQGFLAPTPAPLVGGWSGRGPPREATAPA
jgi:hypothetical protein